MKQTPEPWRIKEENRFVSKQKEFWAEFTIETPRGDYHIVKSPAHNTPYSENKTNAMLMVNAASMYNTLRTALAELDNGELHDAKFTIECELGVDSVPAWLGRTANEDQYGNEI